MDKAQIKKILRDFNVSPEDIGVDLESIFKVNIRRLSEGTMDMLQKTEQFPSGAFHEVRLYVQYEPAGDGFNEPSLDPLDFGQTLAEKLRQESYYSGERVTLVVAHVTITSSYAKRNNPLEQTHVVTLWKTEGKEGQFSLYDWIAERRMPDAVNCYQRLFRRPDVIKALGGDFSGDHSALGFLVENGGTVALLQHAGDHAEYDDEGVRIAGKIVLDDEHGNEY
jgi:hypothetical protein